MTAMLLPRAHVLLLLGTVLLPLAAASYDGYRLLETQELNVAQARALAAADGGWDFWQEPRDRARAVIFVSPEEAPAVEAALQSLGLLFHDKEWTPPRPHEGKAMRRGRTGAIDIDFNTFYRLDEIHAYLDNLAERFPYLVAVESLGRSTEGRDLKLLRINSPLDKGPRRKPAIFIDATIHAREWIAPAVALYIINQLVENYPANSALVDEVDWYILPVINPDGYEYTFTDGSLFSQSTATWLIGGMVPARFWRKTRSQTPNTTCIGTDANRNFNFQWDLNTGGVCSETFAGVAPLSEPEAAALAAYLLERNDSIELYLTLHSYGELLLTPWGYTNDMPEDADDLVGLANKAAAAVAAVRGTNYTVGSSANVLYYSYGTSRDWAKGVAGIKYSYTMELPAGGSGFDPPPEDIEPVVTETFEAIKVFAEAIAASGRS